MIINLFVVNTLECIRIHIITLYNFIGQLYLNKPGKKVKQKLPKAMNDKKLVESNKKNFEYKYIVIILRGKHTYNSFYTLFALKAYIVLDIGCTIM